MATKLEIKDAFVDGKHRVKIPASDVDDHNIESGQYVDCRLAFNGEQTFPGFIRSDYRITIPDNVRNASGIEHEDEIDLVITLES